MLVTPSQKQPNGLLTRFGTGIALKESADARQKRWGKRFRAVLAEIAGQKSGGPPHRTSGLFYFLGKRTARL